MCDNIYIFTLNALRAPVRAIRSRTRSAVSWFYSKTRQIHSQPEERRYPTSKSVCVREIYRNFGEHKIK